MIIVPTYLAQEGFEETRNGWYSRELNVTIEKSYNAGLYHVVAEGHRYLDIHTNQIADVVDACHKHTGTLLLVALYNLQAAVISKKELPIREDI